MKIKKMYNPESLPDFYVIETLDGKFFRFNVTPFRKITEKDLIPIPHYVAKGNNALEAFEFIYRFYGLEKVSR